MLARLLAPPLCWGCGGSARRDDALCVGCRRTLRHLPREPVELAGIPTWAPVSYEGAARELVRGLKFRGAMALADPMSALIVANAPEGFSLRAADAAGADPGGADPAGRGRAAGADAAAVADLPAGADATAGGPVDRHPRALVPVPLHPSRRRARGFNQAEILAAALARRSGLAVADCLKRSGPRGTQVGRPRSERLAAPPGGIRAHGPVPARAIVVDDVATTGATLAACALALRTAGSLEVRAVTFARTLGR
jgi:predicted amidophosphoribosyltransferase